MLTLNSLTPKGKNWFRFTRITSASVPSAPSITPHTAPPLPPIVKTCKKSSPLPPFLFLSYLISLTSLSPPLLTTRTIPAYQKKTFRRCIVKNSILTLIYTLASPLVIPSSIRRGCCGIRPASNRLFRPWRRLRSWACT